MAGLAAAGLGGCTIIHIEGAERATVVRGGALRIVPAPGATLVAYRSQGLGLVAGRSGATLGWAREEAVLLYDGSACRMVVFDTPDTESSRSFWRDLVREHPDICTRGDKP